MKLPEIRNRVTTAHINATPQGYALRILRYYRERCGEKWEVSGLSEGETLLYDLMNKHQDERAAVLDKAIAVLEAHGRHEVSGR